jgi:hypothetical protein
MTGWSDLLSTALVGTRRRPLAVPAEAGAIGALTGAITEQDAASALLDRAAVHTVHRRAGALTAPARPGVTPAPADSRPEVPAAAAQRFAGLAADGGGRDLVREWLSLAAERDLALPAQHLPALLDLLGRRPELAELGAKVGGERMRWLAALRPEWGVAQRADSDADWIEGTLAERVWALSNLRAKDPAAGLARLAEAWPDEPPAERARLLECLRVGLGPSDEELLEQALDDRRKEVRDRAADLLGLIPGSGLGRRMAARAAELVRVHARPGRGDVLIVEPPVECDRAMRRDGCPVKPPQGVGERAFWLVEVLARTPLTTWPDPASMLAMPVAGEFGPELGRGLARAAVAQGAARWAAPLLDALGGSPNLPIEDRVLLEELFALLPPGERTVRARAAFNETSAIGPVRGAELAPMPWEDRLADTVLGHIAQQIPKHRYSARVSELCRLAETGIPPSRAAQVGELAERLGEKHSDHHGVVDLRRLAQTLTQRHDMQKEFA